MARFFLRKSPSGRRHTLEFGLANLAERGESDLVHADHHGRLSMNPSPCNDERVPVLPKDAEVEVSHLDADLIVGAMRIEGRTLPDVDLAFVEKIDCNGSSVSEDLFDRTHLYMVGVGALVRQLKCPFAPAEGEVEITEIVHTVMSRSTEDVIEAGRVAQTKSEDGYRDCKVAVSANGKVGYWMIDATDELDPSRPYRDGIEVVVVHRKHYKSVSVYCSAKSSHTVPALGGTVAGIVLAGHPKASGSPRGAVLTQEDGQRVYDELSSKVS